MDNNITTSSIISSVKRPKSVTLLALSVISIVAINMLGFINMILTLSFLSSFLPFSPVWIGLIRLFWTITGVIIFFGLWFGKKWAPIVTRAVTILFVMYIWIDRFVLANYSGRNNNLLFMGVLSVFMISIVFWILNMDGARLFFGVKHEQYN